MKDAFPRRTSESFRVQIVLFQELVEISSVFACQLCCLRDVSLRDLHKVIRYRLSNSVFASLNAIGPLGLDAV